MTAAVREQKNGLHHKDYEPGGGSKSRVGRDSILTNKKNSPTIPKQRRAEQVQ